MNKYIKLFFSMLYISAFTFGGGYVIVSLMKKKYVDSYKWLQEDEMLNLVAIAQSSPGAVAVNSALLVGKKMAGVLGAVVAVLATIIPPFVIISTISYFYQAFATNMYVAFVLRGMQAGVCAVIIDVVINLASNIVQDKKVVPIIMIVVAFVATYWLDVNLIIVIVLCGLVGALTIDKTVVAPSPLPDIASAEFSQSHEEDQLQQLENHIDDSHDMQDSHNISQGQGNQHQDCEDNQGEQHATNTDSQDNGGAV